jgi:protease I
MQIFRDVLGLQEEIVEILNAAVLHAVQSGQLRMTNSPSEPTCTNKAGAINCSCGKTLAKQDGIQCHWCKAKTNVIHFPTPKSQNGWPIKDDWDAHLSKAELVGCDVCGIQPRWQTQQYKAEWAKQPHFYPGSAIGGGSIERDWDRHHREAAIIGCGICGIKPAQPLSGRTTEERWDDYQNRLYGRQPNYMQAPTPTTKSTTEVKVEESQPAGSHSLAARFMRVPSTIDTRGNDYKLPQFGTADPTSLAGKRVLIISADGPELPELAVPMQFLSERGATVKLAGQDWIFQYRNPAGYIVVAEWLTDQLCIKADLRMSDVNLDEFDAVYIPGGAWNPDMARTDGAALRIVREAHTRGLLVVSVCHGPQVLINAASHAPEGQTNFPRQGVHITGTGSIRLDLENAGFTVHNDDATVYDESANLLTSRDPNDLGPMCEKMDELLRQRKSA